MNPSVKELRQYLSGDNSAAPSIGELRSLIEAYPYFAAPVATMLRLYSSELEPDELTQLRQRLSVMLGGSGPAVRAACGLDDSNFYPCDQARRPDTTDALDTFFATYGRTTPEEEALLERLIFNPVPDYADQLAREADDCGDLPADFSDLRRKPASVQSAPVQETPATSAPSPAQPPQSPDDSLLSESLAKIFIKQGRYERAYEIISNLNLNYPEKSVYFADQLRFLRKLILIQQKNNHK